MEIYKVTPEAYGGIFALLSVGFIGGSQLNILINRSYKSEQIFRVALIVLVTTSLVFLWGAWNNWYGLIETIVLFFIALTCLGLTNPNANALSLAPFTKNVGSASALLGFLQIGIAGLASGGVGLFNATNSVPVAVIMTITSTSALSLLIIGKKRIITEVKVSTGSASSAAH
jgi:DHA1 family bicyclomycin/chloramphenicol resistance-like MFS transporter